jgi:hypothetical protein
MDKPFFLALCLIGAVVVVLAVVSLVVNLGIAPIPVKPLVTFFNGLWMGGH